MGRRNAALRTGSRAVTPAVFSTPMSCQPFTAPSRLTGSAYLDAVLAMADPRGAFAARRSCGGHRGGVSGAFFRSVIVGDDASASGIDARTIAIVAIALIATGILTGPNSIWMAGRDELTRHVKSGARDGVERSWLRVALLVLHTAMSVLLLVGAGQ